MLPRYNNAQFTIQNDQNKNAPSAAWKLHKKKYIYIKYNLSQKKGDERALAHNENKKIK